jgi:hypothetical protein
MEWVVPSTMRERRFCIFDINEAFIQDELYFSKINKELSQGGLSAFFHDMLELPYNMAVLRQIPYSAGTREQIIRGSSNIIQFWYVCLYQGFILENQTKWPESVGGKEIYQLYERFVSSDRFRGGMESPPNFGRTISKHFMRSLMPRIVTNAEGKRVNGYKLETLEYCRRVFDEALINKHMKAEWPDSPTILDQDDDIPF